MFETQPQRYTMGMAAHESPVGVYPVTRLGLTGKSGQRSRLFGALRLSAFLILGALGLFAGGFGLFASHIGGLSTPAQQPSADAIIVLTGGQARLDAAMGLLKSGKGKRLLISGVNPATRPNELRAATGSDRDLFNCCVDIDYEALNTIGNAQESAKWVRDHAFNSVILVTNNYHMPRSLLELGRQVEADVRPYPVVVRRLDEGRWLTEPDALRVLFTEYTKYLASLARGLMPIAEPSRETELVGASTVSG
jgi:uncharacterized SAM-binding protein YcdF (DUF218 family)